MRLVEAGLINLEQPLADYLPEFSDLRMEGGEPIHRQPTLKELLAHRSGIYSQKRKTTARQMKWIRDFGLTLKESVIGIAGEPVIAQPGTEYHYSGAGYCVAGRVCEVAAQQSFEQLLQLHLAAPLELERTTYYPDATDPNVASGGSNGKADPNTPHLTKPELKLPLVGGSLYSTAEETCRFLNMLVHEGLYGTERLMNEATWKTWLSRPYPDGNYGYGWSHVLRESEPIEFHHGGALYSSRSAMIAIPSTKTYGVVHYTLGPLGNAKSKQVTSSIRTGLRNELLSLSNPK